MGRPSIAVVLASITCAIGIDGHAGRAETTSNEWSIGAYGVGRFQGEAKTAVELRAAYPDAEISIEPVSDQSAETEKVGVYVVKSRGEVLFSAPCGCHLFDGKWVVTQHQRYRSLDDVFLRSSTRNPAFKTPEGIGVGSNLGQLRKAYGRSDFDLYTADVSPNAQPMVCLIRTTKVSKGRTTSTAIDSLAFEIALPPSIDRKRLARPGRSRLDEYAPLATISEIFTSADCRTLAGLGAP